MKTIIFKYLILVLISVNVVAQETDNNSFSLGLFIGEGTGVMTNLSLNDEFSLEFNVAYHEIFHKYGYTNKYLNYSNQMYSDVFSASLLLNIKNNFMEISKLKYHFAIGTQVRLITGYYQGIPDNIPPNTIIIDDPTKKNKLDFGISPLIGFEYGINQNISIFFDFGAYIEITPVIFWSNYQFRTGIMYYLN